MSHPEQTIYDVIGVGFGPANLALAMTIEEEGEKRAGGPLDALFLERRERFDWHPDMLMDGARIQLSFLKDFITLRNPRSYYTFLNYLLLKDRLADFINLRNFFPTRLEFNDYYRWVAEQLDRYARYGREVLGAEPVEAGDGRAEILRVRARDLATGEVAEHLARNLVVATGGSPVVPDGVVLQEGGRVFHSFEFLSRIKAAFPDGRRKHRMVVVGSGQSAAEIFQYLYTNYPESEVTAAVRRFGYKPADESQFVNEIFHPSRTDFFYDMEAEERAHIIASHADTNYSAVDLDLIREIYDELYARKVAADDRVQVRPMLELCGAREDSSGVVAEFRHRITHEPVHIDADAMVLATGYQRGKQHPALEDLESYLLKDPSGAYDVERLYRVRSVPELGAGVFLQGFCEATHGLSDTLLSVLPIRSLEIYQALTAKPGGETREAAAGSAAARAVVEAD